MIKIRENKKLLACLLAAVMAAVICGCGKSVQTLSDNGAEMDTEATTQMRNQTETGKEVINKNAENKFLYCITPATDNPYFSAMQAACLEEGENLGYTVKCESHENDVKKQAQLFDAAISEGASAIICDNADASASVEAIQKAKDAGIPTFLVDRTIEQEGVAISQILSDNRKGALQTAMFLVETIGGEGQYAELSGPESDTNSQVRSEAFHTVIDQTNMEMVTRQSADWDETEAYQKTELILQQYPDIAAIVCGNDTMACGAAQAVEEAELSHSVFIIGMDGSDAMRDKIQSSQCLATSLQQIDLMVRTAVNQADTYLTTGSTDAEEVQYTDCILITKENAEHLDDFVYLK